MAAQATGEEPDRQTTEATPEEELSFEEAYRRLEAAVAALEGGEATLEESLRLLEEGIRMSRICQARLDRAQARLEQLVEQDGVVTAEPFDLGPGGTEAGM
ncbi:MULTISPECIES: exodeoxyribonuclease VII small subunit [Limnochorda]|uniref:exodeoxyribonuclease VII small subunit n=1 Tax=Limnochorda TaxID=1676651 RepID=UPI0017FB86BB|nr:exodeoxyribonuclease VII small subunit [Limnochorda pilosa]MBO2487264.1 exodeoxyribonuclease VII small subunit [Bacillota bacterium]MBO2518280.1 exodeoxyribonuclease VII small subunit [Bacillota bacterium]NMA71927.1 exodeoxyribonuclease VII small subunit [Bacillota bacterium]